MVNFWSRSLGTSSVEAKRFVFVLFFFDLAPLLELLGTHEYFWALVFLSEHSWCGRRISVQVFLIG